MKKLFMLFAIMSLVAVASVDAQTCSKSKASCSKTSAECTAAAAKMASLDADIEKRVCEDSGKISFVRKGVCAVSGKTEYTNVEFDADTKKFVNVSPTHTSGKAVKAGASCCAGKAKATSAKTVSATKSCSKGEKAACCASKAKSASTTVKKTSVAKAIKTSN